MRMVVLAFWVIASGCGAGPQAGGMPGKMLVYVGTYTQAPSKGIYLFRLDLQTGAASPVGLAAETANPSFLAVHPNRKFLYAVGEIGDFGGKKNTGAVSSFSIEGEAGKLTLLNQQPSQGAGPCHLVVDREGKNVLVANYGGGSVAVIPVRADGSLDTPSCSFQHQGSSVNPQRQKQPHAHSINLDPAGRFAFAADLGMDKIVVYTFDPSLGTIVPNEPAGSVAPGSGPRHFAFHPSGQSAYVINEMGNTVTAFSYDAAKGLLTEIQTLSTLPADFKGTSHTAEVVVTPDGKFVYGSNRGHDSLAIFAVRPDGTLTAVGHQPTGGKTPRNFAVDPTGRFLLAANQGSDTVVIFRIDPGSGKLEAVGPPVQVPKPVCIRFLPIAR